MQDTDHISLQAPNKLQKALNLLKPTGYVMHQQV